MKFLFINYILLNCKNCFPLLRLEPNGTLAALISFLCNNNYCRWDGTN